MLFANGIYFFPWLDLLGQGMCLYAIQPLGQADTQDIQPMQFGWRTNSVLATSMFIGQALVQSLQLLQRSVSRRMPMMRSTLSSPFLAPPTQA